MIKKILNKVSEIGNLVISWFNFIMFFAMRPCWSGISKTLKYEEAVEKFGSEHFVSWLLLNLPVILWIIFFLIAVSNTILFIIKPKKQRYQYIYNGINIVFFIAVMVVIALGAIDYMDYIWPNFFMYLGIVALLILIIFFIFIYPKTKLINNKPFKWSVMALVLALVGGNLVNFSFNDISTGAVVYAVEDEYQIVFSSRTDARAWVEINDVRYFDNYNGSNRSYTKIHKVSIPMDILNNAKKYEIHVQKITYRGPFGGYFGRDISESYNFTPVNTSDGLNYYSLADIHMAGKAASKAASYMEDKELLVLAGDIVSMMDTFEDANLVNKYAHDITNGSIPVIYARGNHEIKGKYAEEFHNFVGTKGDCFYYSFTLDNLYGVVLDIGEDHDDDYWEYYDTSFYQDYREDQINFLKEEAKKDLSKYDYRLAVCHIPVAFINNRRNHLDQKNRMTEELNKMNIDMMISGHQHDLYIFEPGMEYQLKDDKLVWNDSGSKYKGGVTNHNFINVLVSKRGYTQFDSAKLTNMKSQIGLGIRVDFEDNIQTLVYNTSDGRKVDIVGPFKPETKYGTDIVFDLNTRRHK